MKGARGGGSGFDRPHPPFARPETRVWDSAQQVKARLTEVGGRGELPKPMRRQERKSGVNPARSRHCHRGSHPGSQELSPPISSNQGVDTLSEDTSPCAAADRGSPATT
ncbi:hypothetical protein GCM10018782_27970 [Streptomyces griseoaurantiacus]|nr:hypothetical protein GCM10018782_27970 [Streptomyces griseoaurantiacus]